MNPTTDLLPEQQQDNFIIAFVHFLAANYTKVGTGMYRPTNGDPLAKDLTIAECLEFFRRIQVPPLPTFAQNTEARLISIASEAIQRNQKLMSGYVKLMTLLRETTGFLVPKQDVSDILINAITD